MNAPRPRGALVLLCRSKFSDNFHSFKEILLNRLQGRFEDHVLFVDILNPGELINNLRQPVSLFDIAEVHVLAEYEPGRLVVNAKQSMYIESGKLASLRTTTPLGVTGGEFLPQASVKLWFFARSEKPGINMLNEWSDYFGRRFFFLPLAQLKPLKKSTPVNKPSRPAPAKKTIGNFPGYSSPSFFGRLSMGRLFMILVVIGGINHFVADDREIIGEYDKVVSYEDSSIQIEQVTRNLRSSRGHMSDHSWVFQRTRWDFSFFVAREWLSYSDRELEAAAHNQGNYDEYWASVYRKLIYNNDDRLDNVASALKTHGQLIKLDKHDMASFVLSFVQHIPYKIPGNNLGLLAPPQTVREGYGDCDSKSLLYALIMRKLGYNTVMYLNRAQSHAMAGVSVSATGKFLPYRGARYYFAETTAIGNRIGQIRGGTKGWKLIPL